MDIWWTQPKYQYYGKSKYINLDTLEERFFSDKPNDDIWIDTYTYYKNKIRGTKVCSICYNEFTYTVKNSESSTCSKECRSKLKSKKFKGINLKRKKYKNKITGEFKMFKEEPDLNEWVWWSDPNRVIATKTCIICNKDFDIYRKEKYLRDACSKTCKNKHSSQEMAKTRYYNEN
jgi:hypothetical protein